MSAATRVIPERAYPFGAHEARQQWISAVKIGIIGTGNVGCACAMAAVTRGSAREIVLVNRTRKTAEAVATDMLNAACPRRQPQRDVFKRDWS